MKHLKQMESAVANIFESFFRSVVNGKSFNVKVLIENLKSKNKNK